MERFRGIKKFKNDRKDEEIKIRKWRNILKMLWKVINNKNWRFNKRNKKLKKDEEIKIKKWSIILITP